MRFEKRFFGLAILTLSVLVAGCTQPSDPMLEMMDADLRKTKVDDLSRTMDFVFSEVRFSQKEFRDKVSTGLNRWVSYSQKKLERIDWKQDDLSKPVFEASETLSMLTRNKEFSFLNTDPYYLQEAAWISQVADRVSSSEQLNSFELYRLAAGNYKPQDDDQDPVVQVVKKLHASLEDGEAETLAKSHKVFDWVVRNLQLDPQVDLDENGIDDARLNDSEDLASAGVPGTGYRHYPWQVLLYGRADYVERAKVFMLALRRLEIDSVMLATKSDDGPKPWAVGVAIGDEYYLFDTKLGLAIPGEKIGTTATLAEVQAKPELLSGLDLTTEESLEDDTKYWVSGDDVKALSGLIYISPESVSRRMKALEASLAGENRLRLAYSSDEIKDRLPKSESVDVSAWDIAFKTHQFRQAVREALEKKSDNVIAEKLSWHFASEMYVDNFVPYRTSRARFLKGKFQIDTTSRSRNAIESCQRLMYSDADIDNLGSDPIQQKRLGIRREADQNAQDFSMKIRSIQAQMRLVRRDTGFYLAQCLFDNGSVKGAGNWLDDLLSKEDAERWKDGVSYLLGRSYEGSKEYDEAIKFFSDEKSVQAHGNLIRARILKELVSKL
ncbi:MAG: tol-pal system YbgF family protein [Mariniblastus sp.]